MMSDASEFRQSLNNPPATAVGYCGNVHPAGSLDDLLKNIRQDVADVRRRFCPHENLPFGFWASRSTLDQLLQPGQVDRLGEAFDSVGVIPFTINGFPYGDFHEPVVKHAVYRPTWADDARREYAVDLANLHDRLLRPGARSTISTLPLGWPSKSVYPTGGSARRGLLQKSDREFLDQCAAQLMASARELHSLSQRAGRPFMLCLEPEPGCVLDSADDVTQFFDQWLFTGPDASIAREHLGVCHDVCHSAVMFESQHDGITSYRNSGIEVGKVQISSAVEVRFDGLARGDRSKALAALRQFAEPKYLHQTCVAAGDEIVFYEDLGLALDALDGSEHPGGTWRVHFHVPVFRRQLDAHGLLGTTQREISACIDVFEAMSQPSRFLPHFEIETYAWNVLPDAGFEENLSAGIARELDWFRDLGGDRVQ